MVKAVKTMFHASKVSVATGERSGGGGEHSPLNWVETVPVGDKT